MKRTYLFRFNCTLNISMVRNKERFISVSHKGTSSARISPHLPAPPQKKTRHQNPSRTITHKAGGLPSFYSNTRSDCIFSLIGWSQTSQTLGLASFKTNSTKQN